MKRFLLFALILCLSMAAIAQTSYNVKEGIKSHPAKKPQAQKVYKPTQAVKKGQIRQLFLFILLAEIS